MKIFSNYTINNNMWVISIFPDGLIHAILGFGIILVLATMILRMIPFIRVYTMPLLCAGVILTGFGLFFEGGISERHVWLERVRQMELKVAAAEVKAAQTNTVIQEVVVTKTQVVKERANTVVKYIDRFVDREVEKVVPGPERERTVEIIKYIDTCPIPTELVQVHNDATKIRDGIAK